MNGEVNLELYTVAMTRLNNGFAKMGEIVKDNAEVLNLEDGGDEIFDRIAVSVKRVLSDFKVSCNEFKDFLSEIRDDLSRSEIDFNDFEPFLSHVVKIFPKYEKDLNDAMNGIRDSLCVGVVNLDCVISDMCCVIDQIIGTFNEIYLLADGYFKK